MKKPPFQRHIAGIKGATYMVERLVKSDLVTVTTKGGKHVLNQLDLDGAKYVLLPLPEGGRQILVFENGHFGPIEKGSKYRKNLAKIVQWSKGKIRF